MQTVQFAMCMAYSARCKVRKVRKVHCLVEPSVQPENLPPAI